MIKKKLFKLLAKTVPSSGLRKWLLQQCNYKIGRDVYIGEDILVLDDLTEHSANLIIEDRAAISPRVTFVLYSAPNNARTRKYIRERKGKVVVRQDAWIGTGAVIMPDIEIGEGAVVGSNAVVTRNVPPYTVVAGIPARKIKYVDVPWRTGK